MTLAPEDLADLRRWTLSAVAVIAAWSGIGWAWTLGASGEEIAAAEPSGTIAVDFAPEVAAPNVDAADMPLGAERPASDSVPIRAAEKPDDERAVPDVPPAADPKVALSRKVDETSPPVEQSQAASLASAPRIMADRKATTVAAPREGVPDPLKSEAVVTWRTQVIATIERNKRYPEAARSRRQQGVASVFFLLDRSGWVVEARVTRSSGASALDDEAVALLRRAEPFPVPPSAVPGERVAINMPIRFATK